MKQIFFLPILFLAILVSSCSRDTINGSGNLTSEMRTISTFNKVNSEGVFDLTITQGDIQSIEIIADDNIIHKVITKVVNNELRLYLDDDNNYRDISLQAIITAPTITGIKNSGIGNVLILNVDTDADFNVLNSGTGNISIEGNAQSLTLKNEGSGEFDGFQFIVDSCDAKIVGSGDCNLNCNDYLNIQIEGSGDVHYLGSPTIEADISGSGKIVNDN